MTGKPQPSDRARPASTKGAARVHRWVVDSIENGIASIEIDDGGGMLEVPKEVLPAGARDGQVLRVTIEIDDAATKEALAASAAQVAEQDGQSNDPGGDIAL